MIELLQYDFMRNALLAGLLASVACGIIGVYVVTKHITFISGGIAHASFGGIGLGYFLGFNPIIGATLFALVSALGMGWFARKTRVPEDTLIGILWALGMALGIIFIGLTPGYTPDLFSYLFGNILTVPFSDLMYMVILDAVILLTVLFFYRAFLAISFDEEFSTVIGLPVQAIYLVLLCLIALTVVVLLRIAGMILVLALLTIPAALAKQCTTNLRTMMLLATLFGMAFTIGGLALSYVFDLASGATIILLSGIVFLICSGISHLFRRRIPSIPGQ